MVIAIKRWQVTSSGKPLVLYGDTPDEIREKWNCVDKDCDIVPYENDEYIEYIDKIKAVAEYVGQYHRKNGYEIRECYKTTCFCGKVLIQFTLDTRDNTYVDCVHYQVWEWGYILVPIAWTFSNPRDFYNNIVNVGRMKYIEYNFRSYGQPKLDKPKELKGVKTIGSVDFIAKHCKPQIFIKDNDVWIKHTDYFSPEWRPPVGERIDMPTSYYLKKYFGKTKLEKFIYADCWGSIILRNEAWIKLENLIPLCKYREMNYSQIASDVLNQQKFSVKGMSNEVCLEWERYWQNVVKYVCEYIGVKR